MSLVGVLAYLGIWQERIADHIQVNSILEERLNSVKEELEASKSLIRSQESRIRLRYTVSFELDSLDAGSGGLGLAGVGWEEAEQGRSSDSMR